MSVFFNIQRKCLMLAILFAAPLVAMASQPQLDAIEGTIKDGQEITILGKNFTHKQTAKPLLYWFADRGTAPSPLGRKTRWDGDGRFSGDIVEKSSPGVIVAPGSNKSARIDHGESSGAALGRVSFDSDQLYVWRKRLDDFDRAKDFAIRTRYKNLVILKSGTTIAPGMYMSTMNGSVWGQINKATASGSTDGFAFYSNKIGTVMDKTLARVVPSDETLYFYEKNDIARLLPVARAQLAEGQGVFHTFNHKIIRLWGEYGVHNNNTYIGIGSNGGIYSEYTSASGNYWMERWDNPIDSATRRWAVEEFQYQAGTINKEDGIFFFWQDRVKGWEHQRFRFTTSDKPKKYSDLFQSQVSNGAQDGSYGYYDSLYVDDSWHRVLICAEATWDKCKQPEILIPTEWNDGRITASVRLGSLKETGKFYVYAVNGKGEVNAKGLPSCPRCPVPPFTN